jgi:hypothetical protein
MYGQLGYLQYEALSYTWGAPIFSKSLYDSSSGTHIPITEGLSEALQRMLDGSGTRRLWVDAICINQGSFRERNQQVQNMAKIYRHATAVLVWLGSEERGSAFQTLQDISSRCDTPSNSEQHEADWKRYLLPEKHRLPINDIRTGSTTENNPAYQVTHDLKVLLPNCDILALGRLFCAAWSTRV